MENNQTTGVTVENVTEQNPSTITINNNKVIEWVFYVIGIILIIISTIYFFNDLEIRSSGNLYEFKEERYVGGDAYNFVISAARSGAVMTKSLVMAVLGCSALIIGKLTAIINKLSK